MNKNDLFPQLFLFPLKFHITLTIPGLRKEMTVKRHISGLCLYLCDCPRRAECWPAGSSSCLGTVCAGECSPSAGQVPATLPNLLAPVDRRKVWWRFGSASSGLDCCHGPPIPHPTPLHMPLSSMNDYDICLFFICFFPWLSLLFCLLDWEVGITCSKRIACSIMLCDLSISSVISSGAYSSFRE